MPRELDYYENDLRLYTEKRCKQMLTDIEALLISLPKTTQYRLAIIYELRNIVTDILKHLDKLGVV